VTRGKILVTGAGGFIGGRVVETLHLHGREVRGAVRSWSSAARIGRFPVELVRCDVCRMDQVTQALDGCDAVVHCAVGNEAVTVEGTRNVLEAAQNTGVRRVVCLSTVDVYGEATGEVDETVPISAAGTGYATMKAAAERICEGFARKGVGVVVLRPTIVYGPFSKLWTVRFAERLGSATSAERQPQLHQLRPEIRGNQHRIALSHTPLQFALPFPCQDPQQSRSLKHRDVA